MFTRIAHVLLKRARTIVFAGTLAVAGTLLVTDIELGLEQWLVEKHDTILPKEASKTIAIVQMDPKSMAEMPAWPWPRSTHGELVERLSNAGARQIVFDVNFTRPAGDPEQDVLFAGKLAASRSPVSMIGTTEAPLGGGRYDALPNETIRPHVRTVSGWISVDDQTREVSIPYHQNISGEIRQSMASLLAGIDGTARDGKQKIDWSIQPESIPTYSYSDIVNGRFPTGTFKGVNVVVGATAQTFGDHWSLPTGARLPGVYIHAIAGETLLRAMPVPLGPLPLLAVALLIVTAGFVVGERGAGIAIAAAGIPAMVVIQWAIEAQSSYILDVAPALGALAAAIAFTALMMVIRRLMKAFTTDRGTSLPNLLAMQVEEPAGGTTIAVRLRNHVETAAVLGAEDQAELMRRVRDRIRLASGDNTIYQVDEQSFAWRTSIQGTDVTDSMSGLISIFSANIQIGSRVIDTPISAGIVEDAEMPLPQAVATALLAAKHAGRHDLPWTRHQDVANDAAWRMEVLGQIDAAIEAGHIWVAYQAKHDVASGRVFGAEALVRWNHPVRGPIRPDQFIPVLEDAGRIDSLTMHVLNTSIRDFSAFDDMSVAVNISTRILGRGVVIDAVRRQLEATGFPARLLTLEVTESNELSGDESIEELRQLREMGVKISIDDYGTGQSTLSYLRNLPAHELKIDQSFVRGLSTSRSDQAMIASTIGLAHELGLTVVAEGVETQDIMDALISLECDVIQGYHIGKPIALREFVASIANDVLLPKAVGTR